MFQSTSESRNQLLNGSVFYEKGKESVPCLEESLERTSSSVSSESSSTERPVSAKKDFMKQPVFLADIESCSVISNSRNQSRVCEQQQKNDIDQTTADSRSPVYLATFDSISLCSKTHNSIPQQIHKTNVHDSFATLLTTNNNKNSNFDDDLSDTEESLHSALQRELLAAEQKAQKQTTTSAHNHNRNELDTTTKTTHNNFDIEDDCTIRSQSTMLTAIESSDSSMMTSLFQYVGVSTICSCLTDFVFQTSGGSATSTGNTSRKQRKRLFSPRERRAAMEAILFLWTIPLPGPIGFLNKGGPREKGKASSTRAKSDNDDEEYVFEVTSLDADQNDDRVEHDQLMDPRRQPLQSHISDLTAVSFAGTHVCPLCSDQLDQKCHKNGNRAQIHCPHCHQRMHRDCLVDWLEYLNHQRCPCCRKEMISSQLLKQTVQRNRQQEDDGDTSFVTSSPLSSPREASPSLPLSHQESQHSTVWDIDDLSQAGTSPRGVNEEIIFEGKKEIF